MVTKEYQKVKNCDFYSTPLLSYQHANGGLDTTFWWGFGFKKDSQYRPMFDHLYVLSPATQVCELPKGFKDRPLEITDFITTFGITAAGCILGGIAFVGEYVHR